MLWIARVLMCVGVGTGLLLSSVLPSVHLVTCTDDSCGEVETTVCESGCDHHDPSAPEPHPDHHHPDHHHSDGSDHEAPDGTPLPEHKHHHHPCHCSGPGWAIADGGTTVLPIRPLPSPGDTVHTLALPESPVFDFDRPPSA